jgi:hypothetical protein
MSFSTDIIGIRVLTQKLQDFPLFQVGSSFTNCLSARCATSAIAFCSNFSCVQEVNCPIKIWY